MAMTKTQLDLPKIWNPITALEILNQNNIDLRQKYGIHTNEEARA
jgi:hypothetical protein